MKSRFDLKTAESLQNPLEMRVYTSRLIGREPDLVLHGGGNTSVKIEDTLYVKGSGWDLSDIEAEGFAPVALDALLAMARMDSLGDSDMVRLQREAMRKEDAPNPSVEAILHAVIPFKFVDHTHADAVVTLTNTAGGRAVIEELYGENMLIIDYVMPGFELAKKVYEETKGTDWKRIEGIVLMHHGIFTFDDDARSSYEKMIMNVGRAEEYIALHTEDEKCTPEKIPREMLDKAADLLSGIRGEEVKAYVLDDGYTACLARMKDIGNISRRGGLTPEHVIRIKPFPMIVKGEDIQKSIMDFCEEYESYFKAFASEEHIMLDRAPRWALIKGKGAVVFAVDEKERQIAEDIVRHTARAIIRAEQLGGWGSLTPEQLHRMEYWELEQAKLKRKD